MKHGFSSSVEFVKLLDYSNDNEAQILFEDICECGKKLGKEIQIFKYSHTKEV